MKLTKWSVSALVTSVRAMSWRIVEKVIENVAGNELAVHCPTDVL